MYSHKLYIGEDEDNQQLPELPLHIQWIECHSEKAHANCQMALQVPISQVRAGGIVTHVCLSAGMFCVGEGLIFKNEQERRKPHREGKTDGDESEMCKTRGRGWGGQVGMGTKNGRPQTAEK